MEGSQGRTGVVAGIAKGVLALCIAVIASSAHSRGKPGVFDYYALALSWSPTYCQSDAGRRDRQQCGRDRRFSFVVHGLWPQYDKGWPERCRTRDNWVSKKTIRRMLDIMPSKRLIIHEWKKHGVCSGLTQADYFSLTRTLFSSIKIPARYITPNRHVTVTPEQLKLDFIKTNRWLDPRGIAVQCGNRTGRANLREVRLCFTRKGRPRRCGANERRACRARQLVMPPVR